MQPNLLAVLVAAVVSMLVGYVWYSPKVFGNYWMKISGRKMEDIDTSNMGITYGLTALAGIVAAYTLGWLLNYANITSVSQALTIILIGWVGIFMAATLTDYMFGAQGKRLWLFQGIYHLVRFLIMALILVIWK